MKLANTLPTSLDRFVLLEGNGSIPFRCRGLGRNKPSPGPASVVFNAAYLLSTQSYTMEATTRVLMTWTH